MPLLDDPQGAADDTQDNLFGQGGLVDDLRNPADDPLMTGTLLDDGDTVTGNLLGDGGVADDAFNSPEDERVDAVVADIAGEGGVYGDAMDPDGDPFALDRALNDQDTVTGNLLADSGVTDDLLGVTASDLLDLGGGGGLFG